MGTSIPFSGNICQQGGIVWRKVPKNGQFVPNGFNGSLSYWLLFNSSIEDGAVGDGVVLGGGYRTGV